MRSKRPSTFTKSGRAKIIGCLNAGQSQRSGHFRGGNRSSRGWLKARKSCMPVDRQRFPGTPSTPIGEKTPRSVANGNARFAVAWTRGIARTSEPCKQNPQFLGNIEARLRPSNRHYIKRTDTFLRAGVRVRLTCLSPQVEGVM